MKWVCVIFRTVFFCNSFVSEIIEYLTIKAAVLPPGSPENERKSQEKSTDKKQTEGKNENIFFN